jgi:hypothetical protein
MTIEEKQTQAPTSTPTSSALVKFDFHGDELDVVRGADGAVLVSIRRFCDALGVSYSRQLKKLKEDESIEGVAMMATVAEDGKTREIACIDVRSLPLWLATIHPSKVMPIVREKLIRFRKECADVLADHFLGKRGDAARLLLPMKDIRVEVVEISPAMASGLLTHRNERNRPISLKTVAKYSADMKSGRWELTHQGLAFGPGGEIIDGQHRLAAIVDADVSVTMVVSYFESPDKAFGARLKSDCGHARTPGQILEFAGVVPKGQGNAIAALVVSIFAMQAPTGSSYSLEQIRDGYLLHKEGIDWALDALPGREFHSAIRAAFVFAFPTDRAAVTRFAELVREKAGIAAGSSAQLFVKASSSRTLITNWSHNGRRDCTLKVLRLLQTHMQRKKVLTRLAATHHGYEFFCARREALGLDAPLAAA